MKISRFKNISEIRGIWKKCYSENNELTPFQSYEWNFLLHKKYSNFVYKINFFSTRYTVIYIVFDNNENCVIAPLVLNHSEKIISILGQQDISDYLSFVFPKGVEEKFIGKCISYIKEEFPLYKICYDRIQEDSLLSRCLIEQFNLTPIQKKCVRINLVENFDNNLSKNTRQNLRTAKNRLNTDNRSFYFYNNYSSVEVKLTSLLYRVYIQRSLHRINSNSSFYIKKSLFVSWLKKQLGINRDVLSDFVQNNDNSVVSYMIIDNKIAAFMAGIVGHNNIVYISRLAYLSDFSRYSPGDLMLSNFLSDISHIAMFKIIDLTRGDEEYKLRFGGEVNFNHQFYL